ncbi:hypothetical protein Tco_0026267 [Tanacetum coccineum]
MSKARKNKVYSLALKVKKEVSDEDSSSPIVKTKISIAKKEFKNSSGMMNGKGQKSQENRQNEQHGQRTGRCTKEAVDSKAKVKKSKLVHQTQKDKDPKLKSIRQGLLLTEEAKSRMTPRMPIDPSVCPKYDPMAQDYPLMIGRMDGRD